MSSGPTPEQLLAAKEGQAVTLWFIGTFCILGWEYFICLPQEIERVWKRKFTYVSWLYLANRYYGLVKNSVNVVLLTRQITGIITDHQCHNIYKWQPVSALISTQMSQWIMGLRVYAIYGKSRTVAAILIIMLLVEFGFQVKTLTVVFPIPEPPGVTLPCLAIGPNEWLLAFWATPVVYDTTTFALTAYKTWSINRDSPIRSRTLQVFFRDGLSYFAFIFIMNIINIILFTTQDSTLKGVNLSSTLMFNIIMSCRLVLNMRAPRSATAITPLRIPNTSNIGRSGGGTGNTRLINSEAGQVTITKPALIGMGDESFDEGEESFALSTLPQDSTIKAHPYAAALSPNRHQDLDSDKEDGRGIHVKTETRQI